MRTKNKAMHLITASFVLSSVSKDLTIRIANAIELYTEKTPWMNDGVIVPEVIFFEGSDATGWAIFTLRPNSRLRTGQLLAYERRVSTIKEVLDKSFGISIRAEVVITKQVD